MHLHHLAPLALALAALPAIQGSPHQITFSSKPDLSGLDIDAHLMASHALRGLSHIPALAGIPRFKDTLSPYDYAQLEEHIFSLPERRKVAFESSEDVYEITEGMKALLVYHGVRFMDVTDDDATALPVMVETMQKKNDAFPEKLKYGKKELQKGFYDAIDIGRMKEFLTKFSSFRTRYYRSSTGKDSQKWLLSKVQELAHSKPDLNITVTEFPHEWGQNSLIARLPVPSGVKSKGKIIIGAHQDSTNLLPFLGAPGADDDGSGTTTVFEVLNLLVNADYMPENYDVEMHWYSAEEGGMLGSNAIAGSWSKARSSDTAAAQDIRGMLQMDMTAYVKPGTKERIGVISDFVSPKLTDFIKVLIDEYNTIPWVDTKCSYACSDHSSWTKVGVDSAFAIEATFEDSNTRNIHSSSDTIHVDGFSFEHMTQFVRLATAFILELAA